MSLTKCTSIVQRMDQADQDALLNRLDNYQAVGMTPKQAQLEAAKETLRRLEGEGIQQSARELIETPQFKAWFKDSKVVDADGKPLVVYHGSGNLPESFRANQRPERYGMDKGSAAFFTENPRTASAYANNRAAYLTTKTDGKRGTVYDGAAVAPVYLSFQNPLIVDAQGASFTSVPFEGAKRNRPSVENIAKVARERGHDGLIVYNVKDNAPGTNTVATTYVAFKSEQIKSIFNNGSWDGTNPNISKSARSPMGFYSALADGIESIATKQQPAGGWLAQIKGLVNKGAVKQDEVEWSGLVDWLALQEGKITKQQIADFLDANGVQVQETVLGEPEKSFDIYREGRGVWKGAYIMSYGTREDAQAWVDDHADEGDFVIEEQDDADSPTGTKYEQYSLPGGENYREVLLTLPEKTGTPLREALEAKYGKFGKSLWNTATPEERAIVDKEASGMKVAGQKGYVSSHWDQQNILAHLRVDDRTDADGAKILFVEEIQSDFGQDFKKSKDAIRSAVESDFQGIVDRMKKAGVLEVECD